MNTTAELFVNRSSNEQIEYVDCADLDECLLLVNDTPLMNTLSLFVAAPLMCACAGANVLSFAIFTQREFHRSVKLYVYLRVYVLNSMLINALELCGFIIARRYLLFTNQYAVAAFYYYVFVPGVSTAYYVSSCMDIAIALERLSTFCYRPPKTPQRKKLTKGRQVKRTASPKILRYEQGQKQPRTHYFNGGGCVLNYDARVMCVLIFAFCAITNAPYFFVFEPHIIRVRFTSTNETTGVYTHIVTEFARSTYGYVCILVIYAVRDMLTLVCTIVVNVTLILQLKRYLAAKRRYNNRNNTLRAAATTSPLVVAHKSNNINEIESVQQSTLQQESTKKQQQQQTFNIKLVGLFKAVVTGKRNSSSNNCNRTLADKNATKMVIFICFMSIVEHILVVGLVAYAHAQFKTDLVLAYFNFGANLAVGLKHGLNFLSFYKFNKAFKASCERIVKLKPKC